jgi:NOL1/NOP2/fmu family ribosome biogenesis protein
MRPVREAIERFGLGDDFLKRWATLDAQDTMFVGTPEAMAFDAVRPMRRGLRMLRLFPRSVKPTTWAMQVLGRGAKRNVVDVTEEQARVLANGGECDVEADASDGFVLVRWQGFIVGVASYRRPHLKSQMPRYRPVD